MKKVEAIVRMERFNEVREALHNIGITGLTSYGINGAGMQNGAVQKNRKPGSWDTRELVRKTKLEVVCDDSSLDKVITAIVDSAKTGKIGDLRKIRQINSSVILLMNFPNMEIRVTKYVLQKITLK